MKAKDRPTPDQLRQLKEDGLTDKQIGEEVGEYFAEVCRRHPCEANIVKELVDIATVCRRAADRHMETARQAERCAEAGANLRDRGWP